MESSEEITREIESAQNKASFWQGTRAISALIGLPIAIIKGSLQLVSYLATAGETTLPGTATDGVMISLTEAGGAAAPFVAPPLSGLGLATLVATGALFLFSSYKKWSVEKELPKMQSKLQAAYVVEALEEHKGRAHDLSYASPETEKTTYLNARADNKRWTDVVQSPNSEAERSL